MLNNKPKGISLNKNAVNILGHQAANNPTLNKQPLLPLDDTNLLKQPLLTQTSQQQQPQHHHQQPLAALVKQQAAKFNLQLLKPTIQSLKPTDENYVPHQSPNEPLPPKLRFFGRESPNKQRDSLVSRIPRLLSIRENSKDLKRPTIKEVSVETAALEALQEEEEEVIEDIDKSTSRDAIFLVCEIAEDIYEYMRELELAQSIKQDYLRDQKILTPKVRGRLINWCIAIHKDLKLLPETLYMAVAVIDRYFDQVTVKRQREVQIVGAVSVLIASKYEEIYPPDVGDLLHLTRGEYTREDIFRQEIDILTQLKHDLGRPIPLAFLRRFSKAAHCDLKMHSIAKFLMELSLSEYECSHWRPSLLAAAALYASLHIIDQDRSQTGSYQNRTTLSKSPKNMWNKTLTHYSRYTGDELKEPASTLCKILKRAIDSPQSYEAVKKNSPSIDKWPELKSPRVDKLIKLGQL